MRTIATLSLILLSIFLMSEFIFSNMPRAEADPGGAVPGQLLRMETKLGPLYFPSEHGQTPSGLWGPTGLE